MMRKHKTMLAAGILAAVAVLFTATAFTTTTPKGVPGINNFLTERVEFRLERLEIVLDAMQTAMEAGIEAMLRAMEAGIEAMLRLSDDIGAMADRILEMANEIGEMADRIVATMELMSETLIELVEVVGDRNSAASAGLVSKATLILSPSEGQTLSNITFFELAGGYDDFILYASNDAGMAKTTNILVQDNDLAAALARIKGYVSDDKIYVAAKAVDGGAVSDLSNTVMLYLQ